MYNEVTIYFCCNIMSVFLNVYMPTSLRGNLGWVLLAAAGLNVFLNLVFTAHSSIKDIWNNRKERRFTRRAQRSLKLKLVNREKLFERFPDEFKHFENEQKAYKGIQYCKDWVKHRRWLKDNGIHFKEFEGELEFQRVSKKFDLFDRVESVRLTKAVHYLAREKALKKYERELTERGFMRQEIRNLQNAKKQGYKSKVMLNHVNDSLKNKFKDQLASKLKGGIAGALAGKGG